MKIKILHLFPEAMNLYGEYGNVSIIEKYMKEEGADVEITVLNRDGDAGSVNPMSFDFIYIGSGTESASYRVLDVLRNMKEGLAEYIAAGKPLLATGNSFELFGKKIVDDLSGETNGVGLFDYTVKRTHKKRFLSDALFSLNGCDKPVVGFINKCSLIFDIKNPLFTVNYGPGNDNTKTFEGYTENGFYGTNLIGPLLIRNPHICRMMIDKIYLNAGYVPSAKADMSLALKAYSVALNELTALSTGGK